MLLLLVVQAAPALVGIALEPARPVEQGAALDGELVERLVVRVAEQAQVVPELGQLRALARGHRRLCERSGQRVHLPHLAARRVDHGALGGQGSVGALAGLGGEDLLVGAVHDPRLCLALAPAPRGALRPLARGGRLVVGQRRAGAPALFLPLLRALFAAATECDAGAIRPLLHFDGIHNALAFFA